jgi:hypothetical protein
LASFFDFHTRSFAFIKALIESKYAPLMAMQPGGKAAAEAQANHTDSRCLPRKREGEEDGVVISDHLFLNC